jgi:hypothetical protein
MASYQGFASKAIHAGQEPDPRTGAVTVPISLATTFAQPTPGMFIIYSSLELILPFVGFLFMDYIGHY